MNTAIRPFQNHTPQLGERVFIDPSAVIIGQVSLGDDVSVWPCVSIRGDLLPITIGRGSNVQDGSSLHTTRKSRFVPEGHPLIIGEFVTVGHNATIHGCTLQDRCLIGMGAIILDGAVVESHVLVAAGSLVAPGKHLKKGYLYRGNPAQPARTLTDQEIEFFYYGPEDYIRLKNQYLS